MVTIPLSGWPFRKRRRSETLTVSGNSSAGAAHDSLVYVSFVQIDPLGAAFVREGDLAQAPHGERV